MYLKSRAKVHRSGRLCQAHEMGAPPVDMGVQITKEITRIFLVTIDSSGHCHI